MLIFTRNGSSLKVLLLHSRRKRIEYVAMVTIASHMIPISWHVYEVVWAILKRGYGTSSSGSSARDIDKMIK